MTISTRRASAAKKTVKTAIGALAVAATTMVAMPVTATSVEAGERHFKGKRIVTCDGFGNCKIRKARKRNKVVHHHHHRRNDDGAAIAAGIIGLIGGAVIAGALSESSRNNRTIYLDEPVHPRHRGQNHVYAPSNAYPPAPSPVDDQVITFAGSLEPWTPGWYDWCDARFKTFNPERGTYRGYDGKDHFCVPK